MWYTRQFTSSMALYHVFCFVIKNSQAFEKLQRLENLLWPESHEKMWTWVKTGNTCKALFVPWLTFKSTLGLIRKCEQLFFFVVVGSFKFGIFVFLGLSSFRKENPREKTFTAGFEHLGFHIVKICESHEFSWNILPSVLIITSIPFPTFILRFQLSCDKIRFSTNFFFAWKRKFSLRLRFVN